MDQIHKVRLADIKPSAINSHIYKPVSEDRLTNLANNIKRNGLLEPLLVNYQGVIISGHTRYRALKLLGRKFVEVRRIDVSESSPEFLQLLTSANSQRIKSDQELAAERRATINPDEYQRRAIEWERPHQITDLEAITGALKNKRTLSDNGIELVNASIEIINENIDYAPLTLRRLHYLLLNNPPRINERTGERYDNTPKHYKLLSRVITTARVKGYIPFELLTDHTRRLNDNRGFDGTNSYLAYQRERLLTGYFRDLQQTQPRYIAIVCEKETVAPMLDPIGQKWGIPVIYTKGAASIDIRYRLVRDWIKAGEKPITILFISDLDPAGYRIQDSFIGSLQSDFIDKIDFIHPMDIQGYRVALTPEQVIEYDLHSDMDAKPTDPNYLDFLRRTGARSAYEIDAMPPKVFIGEIEDAIRDVVDLDLFNVQQYLYNLDIQEIESKRAEILGYL